jgi:hypothetical protein
MLQIILGEQNVDFHHRTGEILRAIVKCPDPHGVSTPCPGDYFAFEHRDVQWRNPKNYKTKLEKDKGGG